MMRNFIKWNHRMGRSILAMFVLLSMALQSSNVVDVIDINQKVRIVVDPSIEEQKAYLIKCLPTEYDTMQKTGKPYFTGIMIIEVSPFRIDKYPVSMKDYIAFCKKKNLEVPEVFNSFKNRNDFLNLPAVGLSWDEANRYCVSRSMRLPSKREYEFLMYRKGFYPFDIDKQLTISWPDKSNGLVSIGSNPNDVSPLGVVDIYSNIGEWTGDDACNPRQNHWWKTEYPNCKQRRIVKKAPYEYNCQCLDIFYEIVIGTGGGPGLGDVGFRCAVNLPDK